MNKYRWTMLYMIIQTCAVAYWFGAVYAPVRFPSIHSNFELGNWMMGLFLGWTSAMVGALLIALWCELGGKR